MRSRPEAQRTRETVRLLNEVLQKSPVDLSTLRKISAVRGLASDTLRARVWPLLLGVEGTECSARSLDALASLQHRDSAVVQCDVARSLWSVEDEGLRARKRLQLARLLNAVVALRPGVVHYYQARIAAEESLSKPYALRRGCTTSPPCCC